MNMHLIDWSVVFFLLVVMTIAAHRTKKYTRSVADFLAANRCAGRYLTGVSDAMAGVGAISVVAMFEGYYMAGFTFIWWALIREMVIIVISLSGWIQYRFRQTRALTMAQFLEMRYSRRFRVYAGIVAFVSGTLNFGIFPAVGARFFMYFCGLSSRPIELFGLVPIDLTYASIMVILLGISLYFTFAGGQIAVIVTDFIQSTCFNTILVIIVAFIFIKIPWAQVLETLSQKPPGESMLQPLDTEKIGIFNKWYYIILGFGTFWTWLGWQGSQGYFTCARNAHEARMGRAISAWRQHTQWPLVLILAISAYVIMHNPNWSALSANATGMLETIGTDHGETIRKQVTTSVALSRFLPVGLFGGFCAVMLAAFISTHDTYLHSWGSIFIQDVILPFRKKHLSPKAHMNLLRWSIFGVAVFIFLFSLLFAQYDAILMFFVLTGTLWLGGAGTVIVFGLYWKRGTTTAAYAALTVGIVIFLFGIILQKSWPVYHNGQPFPLTSTWIYFIALMLSISLYVIISLCGKKSEFNLDKMLHHGKYAIAEDATAVAKAPVRGWQAIFGINKDFTFTDKIVYCAIAGWTIIWVVTFAVVTLYDLKFGISTDSWAKFWHFYVWMGLILAAGTTIWVTFGGLIDLKKMFHRLRTMARDEADDGTVVENNDSQPE